MIIGQDCSKYRNTKEMFCCDIGKNLDGVELVSSSKKAIQPVSVVYNPVGALKIGIRLRVAILILGFSVLYSINIEFLCIVLLSQYQVFLCCTNLYFLLVSYKLMMTRDDIDAEQMC